MCQVGRMVRYGKETPKIREFVKNLEKLTEIDWSYLAGLIDGDGTVSVYHNKNSWTPTVKITNSDRATMDIISKMLKQKLYVYKKKSKARTLPLYTLQIFSLHRLIPFLKGITPFLKGKRKRAELLLELCQSRAKADFIYDKNIDGRVTPRLEPYSEQEKELIRTIRMLNSEGKGRHYSVEVI